MAAVGAAAMMLSGSWRNELIVPGPLSAQHAHLARGANANLRCAQCHAAADGTAAQWLGASPITLTSSTSQSTLCLQCHDTTIAQRHALAAHTIAWDDLRTAASGQGRRDPTAGISCSTCHREHQGRMHDLTAITNDACQACHSETFPSFAKGHPEFGSWPYKRRTRIAFDHASHSLKHHPASQKSFDCAACHRSDASGARQTTLGYEAMCASCHDKALTLSMAGGVPIASIPTLDSALLAEAGLEPGAWPEEADGDFDGAIPVWSKLLLSADADAAAALTALGPDFDYYDLDIENVEQLGHGATVARALKNLVDDIGRRGTEAVSERLSAVLGHTPEDAEVAAVATGFDGAAQAFSARWFGDEASGPESRDPGPDGSVRLGWRLDDASLSLRRETAGHADPWLKAWLDLLAAAATGPRAAIAEPLLKDAMRPKAAGQCGSCHTVEQTADGRLAIQWLAGPGEADASGSLTHFVHEPHLVQTQLRDCKSCHEIAPQASTASSHSTYDPDQFVADFSPLIKSACIACHSPAAAGDGCTQCHRYHGHDAASEATLETARLLGGRDAPPR